MTPPMTTADAVATGKFEVARPPNGQQLRCLTCRALGYPFGPWYDLHSGPHEFQCERGCERTFATSQARRGHYARAHPQN